VTPLGGAGAAVYDFGPLGKAHIGVETSGVTMDLIAAAVTVTLSIGLGLGASRIALETIFLAMARNGYCAGSRGPLRDERPAPLAPVA